MNESVYNYYRATTLAIMHGADLTSRWLAMLHFYGWIGTLTQDGVEAEIVAAAADPSRQAEIVTEWDLARLRR